MNPKIPSFLLSMEARSLQTANKKKFASLPFIDRTLKKAADFIETFYNQGETALHKGLLQQIDSRIKVIFLLWFILLVSLVATIQVQMCVAAFIFLLFWFSHIQVRKVYKRIFVLSFFFGFLLVAPASLNIITPGKLIVLLWHFPDNKQFWIYHIPSDIGITLEGLVVVTRLYLKVLNSISLTLLVYYTTPFASLLKALSVIRVPDMFLMIIALTYKFIFILSNTVQETYFALKLRWWKKMKSREADKIIAGRILYLFRTSWYRYEEVYKAMIARGFHGKVEFCYPGTISRKDIIFLASFIIIGIFLYIV